MQSKGLRINIKYKKNKVYIDKIIRIIELIMIKTIINKIKKIKK